MITEIYKFFSLGNSYLESFSVPFYTFQDWIADNQFGAELNLDIP